MVLYMHHLTRTLAPTLALTLTPTPILTLTPTLTLTPPLSLTPILPLTRYCTSLDGTHDMLLCAKWKLRL